MSCFSYKYFRQVKKKRFVTYKNVAFCAATDRRVSEPFLTIFCYSNNMADLDNTMLVLAKSLRFIRENLMFAHFATSCSSIVSCT